MIPLLLFLDGKSYIHTYLFDVIAHVMKVSRNCIIALYIISAVVVIATVAIQYAVKLTDNDLWFHLAYGRYILDHWTLIPDHSIFSWTPAVNNTIYCAWIPEIIFYLLYKAGGMPVFFIMRYLCIIVFVLLALTLVDRKQINTLPVILLVLLLGLLMSISGVRIKAEIFSFVFMTIMVWTWFRIKTSPSENILSFYVFPMLVLLWVNSHGGFIFGMAFLGAVVAGEIIHWLRGSSEALSPMARKHLFISTLFCFLAIFITPYGWHYPAQLLNNLILHPGEFNQHTQGVMEYQTIFYPDARSLHFIDYLILSLGLLTGMLVIHLRRHKPDWSLLLSNALFIFIYMRYLRTTYFWAIIFVFSALFILREIYREDSELLLKNRYLKAIVPSATLAILFFYSARAQYTAFCSPDFGFSINYSSPITEAEYIHKHFPHLRMGNDYNSGSYLIWALWPQQKVFIDSRFFPYAQWYSTYDEFLYGQDKTLKDHFLNTFPCEMWCLTYDFTQLRYFMDSPDWRLVYYGPSACIFLSSHVRHQKGHEVAETVYDVTFYQALSIAHFALEVGDLSVSKKILSGLRPLPFCRQQKKLALQALLYGGSVMYSKNRFMDAADLYASALRIDPDSATAYYMMGNAQARLKNMDKAMLSFREAIRIKPDHDMAHNNLANVLLLMNKLEEATKEYSEALRINPQNSQARKNLNSILSRGKNRDNTLDQSQ
ncbi:MAG TPA: tetratricopeptide repeat protein, partial [Deltaproteobacteria bacterium]|nr:tetratricopeptide repeat protein [Deltaproteobacteria bacterium]